MTSEHVFPTRLPAGASVLRRNCDVLRTITNLSDELNMVCVRVGIEVIWSHVLLGRCSIQLLGPIGIPVVKTRYHDTCILCEHDVEIQCVELPLEERRTLTQTEPVRSGNVIFVAGEAHQA